MVPVGRVDFKNSIQVKKSIQFFGGCSPEGFPQSLKLSRRPFRKILRNKSPTSWDFLASCGATNLHSMTRGYSFMPGGVFEHILARLRASYCARIPFFRGWVRIVSSFSGTSPGSTVCFCSFLAQRRARNDSLDFCALQHIKCSRSAVSE